MFSVVLPVYIFNEHLLNSTVDAVNSFGNVELIIIDNASTLGGGWLRQRANIYIRNQINLGYAKAVNQGIKLANGKHIAIASNDVVVKGDWQNVATDVFKEPCATCHFKVGEGIGKDVYYTGRERWCTAAFFVMRDKNYFNENFLNSFEDWELFHRLRLQGGRTAYTNKATYLHNHSLTKRYNLDTISKDNKNLENFIKIYGKHPDELMNELYPLQMREKYLEGFL